MGTDVDSQLPSEDSAPQVVSALKAPAPSTFPVASPNSVLNVGPLLQWKGASDNSGTSEVRRAPPWWWRLTKSMDRHGCWPPVQNKPFF
jgi:hypothetical protein